VAELRRHRFADLVAEPISHYTDAVSHGGQVYVSGLLPLDPGGHLVGGDAEAQADQILASLAALLGRLGGGLGDVAKVTVYLVDIADREAVNRARRRHFGDARPASSLVQVAALAHPGALVEIEAVAFIEALAAAR
jgi:2-iminobutanoate/2-iminopropanoate deaminase